MITLTNASTVLTVLGGTTLVGYNKMVLAPFSLDRVNQAVNATIRLTSIADPQMQPIFGTLAIRLASSELLIEVAQLDFLRRVALNAGQITALIDVIEAAQAALENGIISLGLVAGTRTVGV